MAEPLPEKARRIHRTARADLSQNGLSQLTSGNHLEFLPNPLKLRELFNDT